MTYQEWKFELIQITARELKTPEWQIKINDMAAKEWYDSGVSPYMCFRENWQSDGD